MKLITDRPIGLSDPDFICAGMVADSGKDYACLLQRSTKQKFIEEVHWGRGKNIHTSTLHQVQNDQEWIALFKFVTECTTIFSPRKINWILKQSQEYFYSTRYTLTGDYQKRKKKGIL